LNIEDAHAFFWFFTGSGMDVSSVSRAMLFSGSSRLDTIGIGRIKHAAVVRAYLTVVKRTEISVDAVPGVGVTFVFSVKRNEHAISNGEESAM
jgi:hypothetical protein